MRRLAVDSKLLEQGLLCVADVLSIGDASSKDLQLGRLARHNVGMAAPTILKSFVRRRRPPLRRKYFRTKPPSRPGKGAPHARHATSLEGRLRPGFAFDDLI